MCGQLFILAQKIIRESMVHMLRLQHVHSSPIEDKPSLLWSGSVDFAAAMLLFAWGENGTLVVGSKMSVQVVSGGTVPPGSGWWDSPSRYWRVALVKDRVLEFCDMLTH